LVKNNSVLWNRLSGNASNAIGREAPMNLNGKKLKPARVLIKRRFVLLAEAWKFIWFDKN